MRKLSSESRCTALVATSHSPIEITAWTASLRFPLTPSERRCVIFVQSSMKPSSPQASIVPKTARLAGVRSPRIRYGTATDTIMIRPPIVGVPALPWWPAGPSSRICWPNSLSRRYSMNFGPRNMQRSSEAMPAMRISPSMSAREYPLEPRGARPLHEHPVARLRQLLEHRAGLLRAGHGVLLALEAAGDRQRGLADRDQQVDAQ